MKIAHLVPGSGGTFYCENCLRDTSLVAGLEKRGTDVVMVPLYLPLFGHEKGFPGGTPIFFGGINTWLQEHVPLFRSTPRWVDSLFDAEPLLRAAATRAGSTSPKDLGPMTLSMLLGEEGHQAKELERLADWLAGEVRPDVIHLSNALLLGLARHLRKRTGAAVVCTLQDETPWIDAMKPPWPERVYETMRERSGDVAAFVSVSRWYARQAADRIGLSADSIAVIPIGVDVDAYGQAEPNFDAPVLGYMARESEGEGLGVLVDAFIRLRGERGRRNLTLRVTGGRSAEDLPFLKGLRSRISDEGLSDAVVFTEDFGWKSRRDFLRSLTLFSVPGTAQAAFGLHVLEAQAAGVPAVQPGAGAFPELIGRTGGGVLYDPGDENALTAAIDGLLDDPERIRRLGADARAGAGEHFSLDGMASSFADLYRRVAARK